MPPDLPLRTDDEPNLGQPTKGGRELVLFAAATLIGAGVCLAGSKDVGSIVVAIGFVCLLGALHRLGRSGPLE